MRQDPSNNTRPRGGIKGTSARAEPVTAERSKKVAPKDQGPNKACPYEDLRKPASAGKAGVEFCARRGLKHPKLAELGAYDAAIVDLPMDSKEYRSAFIRIVRDLDVSASLNPSKIDSAALVWYGGLKGIKKCYGIESRPAVPVQGLAGGHTLPELLEGCKLQGAQGLVALMPNPKHKGWHIPVAYLNYWTDVKAPQHMQGLMELVRSQVGTKEKFALADTVVCLPEAPKGMYRALLAHATLELYEKASGLGITKVYDIVRLEPNPNPAIGAHEKLGWKSVKKKGGGELELFDKVVSEATQQTMPARFQVVCLDLKSPQIPEQLETARSILSQKRIVTVDFDGCTETYDALKRCAPTDAL